MNSNRSNENHRDVASKTSAPHDAKVGKPTLDNPYIVLSAEFHYTAPNLKALPEETLPEVAFVGRSNVGKSSLLANLTSTKKLVRVSKTPGQTQAIHFFAVHVRAPNGEEKELYFVDLPGYGYGKMSGARRHDMGRLLSGYLGVRNNLVAACHLLDVRHSPTGEDREVFQQLREMDYDHLLVATKADKISKAKRSQARKKLAAHVDRSLSDLTLFSVLEKIGRDAVWGRIWDSVPDVSSQTLEP
jgi:GTP-binding protein